MNVFGLFVRSLFAILVALTAGCANLAPVREYATQGRNIAVLFKPMVGGREDVCRTRVMYHTVITAPDSVDVGYQSIEKRCVEAEAARSTVVKVADLVTSYYETLAAAAGADLPASLDKSIGGFVSAAGKFKPDGVSTIWSDKQIKAASNLATALSNAILSRWQLSIVKDLLAVESDLVETVGMLKTYVDRRYRSEITQLERDSQAFVLIKPNEPGSRYVQWRLREDLADRKKGLKAADAFDKAAADLLDKHHKVRESLGKLSDEELLSQLLALQAKVRELKNQIDDAF